LEISKLEHDKIKICVVGVGHLGEYHVQKYKALPNVDLIGIVDTNPDRAKEIAHRYDTKVFRSHEEVLGLVDAVSLAVPTEAHFDVAKDILNENIHLLIEKPITYMLEPADTLIKMARERGLILQVGLVERFNPAVIRMESMLNQPLFIEAHRMNLFTTRGTDVDVVLDLMIHDLDVILHLVPSEVKEVHAVGMCVITGKTDIANVRLIFENGTVANLTASRVSDKTFRKIRAFQPDAYLLADCLKREFCITRLDNETECQNNIPNVITEKETFPKADPLADQIGFFVNSVINGGNPEMTLRDERKALKIALGVIEQIRGECNAFQPID
jgi:predicted dehydrogenase